MGYNSCNRGVGTLFDKVCILVMDSVGVGAMPDAPSFGDEGSNTIAHVADAVGGIHLPNLARLGLGHLTPIKGTDPATEVRGAHGKMNEASAGKDTITGHWEMAGVPTFTAFTVFSEGFPAEIIEPFVQATGRGILGNHAASGTVIIEELGPEHIRTGKWIVYTSADSVFQIAAHEDVIPLEELYAACKIARDICDKHQIARIIARPFIGEAGSFQRTYNRHDYSMLPHQPTLCDELTKAGIPLIGIGKIADIFAHQGVEQNVHTEGNTDGIAKTIAETKSLDHGVVFCNLVDFDMVYGHRRNPTGYATALLELDAAIPELVDALGDNGLLLLSADHGCDPTHMAHTDHTREYVPVLCGSRAFKGGVDLGTRETFADLGQTVAANFGVSVPTGTSFLNDLRQVL